jgi:hypothetical protein
MEPDHIRVVFPNLFQEFPGGGFGTETVVIQQPVHDAVDLIVQAGADAKGRDILAVDSDSAVGQQAFVALKTFYTLKTQDSL